MAAAPESAASKGLLGWIDQRFPLTALWRSQASEYYAPKNFNFWYYFGSLALFVLVNQLVTGIFLTMSYKPSSAEAFSSIEYIMRDVSWGWLIRYMHSTGASAFFIVIYLHMFRALLYGSHRKPRELLWIFGCLLFLVLMAEGFMGYVVLFAGVIFFAPTFGGLFLESPNFAPANPLQTPPHIAPVWYFTPSYAMLRAVPSFAGTQVWGVMVMGASIVVLFFVPWLDRSPVNSIRYRGPIYKIMLTIFVLSFISLGLCGLKPPSGIYPTLAKICTVLYFAFF